MTGGATTDLTGRLARLSAAKRALLEHALLARRAARTSRIPRRTPDGPAPLSFAQRGMWFLDQWQPDTAVNTMREAFHLSGPLDVGALRRAVAAVVRRHDVLRATFAVVAGQPVQAPSTGPTPPVPVIDLQSLRPADRDATVRQLLAEEARCPFDLARGPLLRAGLLRSTDTDHVLFLSLHHIVADGWSYALLIHELSTFYAAIRAGRPADVAELPVQYADYAAWQDRSLRDDPVRAQLEWWKSRLAGSTPVLNLPTDRTRPAVLSYRGGNLDVRVPPAVTAALKALSRREGATLFMTLLAAFQALLHRYSGDTDIVVGCPVAGRTDSDLENLIGCFVNTLPIRTDLTGAPTFRALLGRVREGTLAAYAHQDVPFEWLVEELRLARNTDHSPVFQVMFTMQNVPVPRWNLPGVAVESLGITDPAEPFDLSMTISDTEDGLAGVLSYSADLFDESTVAQFARSFESLLAALAEAPERPITELPIAELPIAELPIAELPIAELPAGRLRNSSSPAPADPAGAASEPVAELVHAIWREVLGVERIEPETDFFAAGGHSLLAVQVIARVRQTFGIDLPVPALFEAPALATFARRVEAASRAGTDSTVPPIRPAGREGPIPPSHAQRRLWFMDQLDRSGAHHNVTVALRVDGPLEAPALGRAVDAVRRRHESLRTTFRQAHGALEQIVTAHAPVPTPLIDLSDLPDAEREEAARRLAEAAALCPIDVGRGPLLRVNLVRLGATRHLLVVTIHHIVTDAWSSELFFAELWELYTADIRGVPARLAPLTVQYADYAIWEHRWRDDAALEKAIAYWRRQLNGVPEALDLAFDHPLPMSPVFTSVTLPYELSRAETRDLVEFSLREGVTLFMTVLAGYLVLLHRRTGQADIVVGTGTANRSSVQVERMIGFFTNQLVLRTAVPGDGTVRELLARVRDVTLSAYAHGEMPFDRLVDLLRPPRRVNRPPLFHVEIEYHRRTDRPPGPPGLTITPEELHSPTTTLDLSLHVVQTETVVRGALVYNADVFAAATARRMLGEFRTLLAMIVAEPDATVDEVATHAENEWRQAAARERAAAARARFDSVNVQPVRADQRPGGR